MNAISKLMLFPLVLLVSNTFEGYSSDNQYFPDPESKGGWRKLEDPAAVRRIGEMDPEKIEELREWLLKSDKRNFAAVVIRHGYIVLEVERGNSAKTDSRRVASVSKAICATVLGIAAEQSQQGRTPRKMDFDDPAFDFIPQAQPLSDPRKAKITVRQLLNHTSGITPEATGARNQGPWKHVLGHDGDPRTQRLAFDPGTYCGYSTFALYHASLVCENVTGKPYDKFAIQSLLKPIGCEHWWFQQFEGGNARYGKHPSHATGLPARDLARIAYCMLQDGRWKDKQIIPKWFVAETAQSTHSVKGPEMRFKINAETFSHGWELPARLTGENGTPSGHGIPPDARYKPGSGGQLIAFVPSLDLVVTRQTGSSGQWGYAEYLRRACAAVLSEKKGKERQTRKRTAARDHDFDESPLPRLCGGEGQGERAVAAKPDISVFQTATACTMSARISPAGPQRYPKWSKIEWTFAGPDSKARGKPNPFDVRLDVVFRGPNGTDYRVPGFYDGDGEGGENGNEWKVRFSADQVGKWTFTTVSSDQRLDGKQGQFLVSGPEESAEGYWKWGRLEYTGTPHNHIRYLKFRDGPYWMKAGCDDPENFLGSYHNFDTLSERLAAVDYLAGHGINSLYLMTHNLDGDDKDVWPWLGKSAKEARANSGNGARFDIAKLEQWCELFEHMQAVGVVPYLILEDDSAWKRYDHDRYYREMVARFGFLPAVVFNLGEEHNENYSLNEGLALAQRFKAIDVFGHPLAIHNVNRAHDDYVDSPCVDLTSIQTGQPGRASAVKFAVEHNRIAVDWIGRCKSRGRRVLVINFDEGRPELDRRAWWSAYVGGGVWEAHTLKPYDQPLSAWERVWIELGGARRFMESLPFQEMEPRNDLVVEGTALCLAKPDRAYAVYLPQGGPVTIDLGAEREYSIAWWNPANGYDGEFQNGKSIAGGRQRLTAPGKGDWAVRIIGAD